ncbi:MAG: response regulator [Egibacteraceae bacterium]
MSIRVLLVDDQALVRTGFRMILDRASDIDVVGEAGNGAEAIEFARDTQPDVILMDVRMPGVDGVEATRRIRAEAGEDTPRILFLTTFDLDEYVYAGLRAGGSGFLLKDTLAPDLLSAIRVVAAGEAVVGPTVTRRLLERFVGADPDPTQHDPRVLDVLTDREREVLTLVARGLSNAEIAERLYLSNGTIKTHVSRILSKLGLRDRVQAVVLAYDTGLARTGF